MSLIGSCYDKVLAWAAHRQAQWYLFALSFSESSFFPIPPDVMLAPMSLAKRSRAFYFALLTTIASVLGGIAGYFLGVYFFEWIEPLIQRFGYEPHFVLVKDLFLEWGVWIVIVAGFTPIPYKVFTISAGLASMAFVPFVLASFIGRGARFFLVAGIIWWGGERMARQIRSIMDRAGWVVIGIFALIIILVYLFK